VAPLADPCWSCLFMKDCTPWKEPTLGQLLKNCSPWEVLTLEKFVKESLLWEEPYAGAGDVHEEKETAEIIVMN